MAAARQRLDEYLNRVGDIQRRAEQAQAQIKQMRAQASSPDGTVSVTLAPGGRLERLTLTPQALDHGHHRLATLITETIRAGHAAAAQQVRDAMEPLVGGTPAMEFLSEQMGAAELDDPAGSLATPPDQPLPPAGPPHSAPPRPRRRPDGPDDDDGWQSDSVLR
jgi:DNA-binding protein YbaB